MKHLYLGIDWGKNFSQLFGFDQAGEVVIEERLKTLDLSVWRKKLRSLKGYSIHAAFEIGRITLAPRSAHGVLL